MEKGQQVALMDKIYSKTLGNLVYLGEPDAMMVDRISRTIRDLCKDAKSKTNNFKALASTVKFPNGTRKILGDGLPWDVDVEAIHAIVMFPWFR